MGYWDSADGEHCPNKTWAATQAGAGLGLVGSAYHIVALPPKSVVEAVRTATNGTLTMGIISSALPGGPLKMSPSRVKKCLETNLPAQRANLHPEPQPELQIFSKLVAALGAIFGVTTCLTSQIRGTEDDPLNYFIGGCASGILLGVRTHSYMTGTSACLGLGTLAALTKMGMMEGWRLSGPPKL